MANVQIIERPASSIHRSTSSVQHPECHVSGRRIRRDALPEHVDFQDRGCELAPSCLRCPLVHCRYDEPGGARKIRQDPRDEAIRVRHAEGVAIDALASEFSISRRSVFRVLARARES